MNTSYLSMTGTFSKHPRAFGFEDDLAVMSGNGAKVTLNDGNTYLDWVCGLGTNLLGYNDMRVITAVERQLRNGVGFSLPNQLEYAVAEKLVNFLVSGGIVGWDKNNISVRFAKTGTDGTAMAVRLARAVTGKEPILSFGYHGWASEFSDTSPALGIPVGYQRDLIRKIKWNDKSSVMSAAWREDFAAIIVEHPVDETDPDWYDFLRRICDESKALLILDEVVTGLRFGPGGAASLYNAMPDLIVMGKALGNGVPISALVGRKEYMDWFSRSDPVFCSSTHWGEALGLAAASAVLDIWNQSAVEYIWSIGKMLMDGLAKSGYVVVGHPPRSLLKFDNKYDQAFFIHEMRERDILMNRPNFISTSHSQHSVKETVAAANEVAQLREKTDPSYYKLPFVLFTGR